MRAEEGPGWVMYRGDCLEVMAAAKMQFDHVICDPPYSETVHSKSRRGATLPDVAEQECRRSRVRSFGFESLSPDLRAACAGAFARLAKRWVLVFSDVESSHLWRGDLSGAKLDYVRTGAWVKQRATPQFTGDRPAAGYEAITICHPKGRKKWNGGGTQGVWTHPVVANCLGHRHDRVHTAQKPLSLMMELVTLFTDPGDVVFDPFAGSATTGVACLRLGRKFVGVELDEKYFDVSCERLRAEADGSTLERRAVGQVSLFGAK